ncbi:amidohydrolase [Meiothermus sp. QL-1]|uniref:amidohydrolase family protein n=1 Tax=Meiothermus sp. QL-1 TaxID=2058095 RepID=UPI000E0B0681|nr:amidohydrolase family protein [Meiothermus sp. QL-1]RDI95596.1 amidohydrolase [Meiothermus sp. QL-1]
MRQGGLLVRAGQVAAAGPLDELRARYPEAPVIPKGRALSPRVANAHTHLDLSTLSCFQGSYTAFIRYVVAHRAERTPRAVEKGLAELVGLGVGAFGDIAYRPEVVDWLVEHSPLPGVVYLEVIHRDPREAEAVATRLMRRLEGWRKGRLRVGLAPHTPFNVSGPLLQKLARLARQEGFPLQMHVAESPEEVELMTRGSGPLQKVARALGLPPYPRVGLTPVRYLAELGVLGPHLTIVHGVQVDEEEVRMLAQSGTRVVACPRSNAALGCGAFPWRLYLRHGVEVALGTDSRASSPDLDVRNEALFLWEQVDPRILVRAAVRGGYRVLGLEPPRLTRGSPVSQVQSW